MGRGAFLRKSGAALGQTGAQANCGLLGKVREPPERGPARSEIRNVHSFDCLATPTKGP